MRRFNEYHSDKKIAQEKQELYVREEEKLKKIEEETKDAGWDSFDSNPSLVDQYIEYITRHSK